MDSFAFVLCWLLYAYWVILLLYVILSWVPRPPDPIRPLVRGIHAVVEPVAAPLRRVIPPVRAGGIGFDLSIIVLFVVVLLLRQAFCG